jgi:CRISPR-associated endonuclease/helicase Cas3
LPEGTPITELAPNSQDLFNFYKRVKVKPLAEKLPDEELIARLKAHEQVLCIVNTLKHASGLYGMLKGYLPI